MTQPQPLDLDAIEARTDAATHGPWGFYDGDNYADIAADLTMTSHASYSYRQKIAHLEDENYWDDPAHEDDDEDRAPEQMAANAAFIAHARADVPALAAEIRRLRADDPHAEIAKLIRWHGEDETAMTEMRATITRLRTELAAANSRLAEPGRPDVEARCGCPHPEGEHSVYGCADGCGCEWMPKRPPMDPVHILGIKPDEATPADPQPVHHAPGIVIRCADCRAKGHTVCMDDAVSQPKGAGL